MVRRWQYRFREMAFVHDTLYHACDSDKVSKAVTMANHNPTHFSDDIFALGANGLEVDSDRWQLR